jgi:hypothetical protein
VKNPGEHPSTLLARVEAPHFVAGIILENDTVIHTAPILRYMNGWTRTRVRRYCERKTWKIRIVRF